MRNVEIKARVHDMEWLKSRAAELSGGSGTVIKQRDTFFRVPQGRLKLRFLQTVLSAALGLLGEVRKSRILHRVGQTRIHLDTVDGLGHFMELELCDRQIRLSAAEAFVKKYPKLTEGRSLSAAVVELKESQTVQDGQEIAEMLMKQLRIEKRNLVSGAYLDLLQQKP